MKLNTLSTRLATHIKEYESDTFSSEGSELTIQEAHSLAMFFLNRHIRGGDIDNRDADIATFADNKLQLDGVQIDEVLGWLREGELDKRDIT